MSIVMTTRPPEAPSNKVASFKPTLLQTEEHHLCPGCGEPVAIRLVLEVIEELGLAQKNVSIIGHGCYGSFIMTMDVDSTLCLHGRAPAVATGPKRMRPEVAVWTLQAHDEAPAFAGFDRGIALRLSIPGQRDAGRDLSARGQHLLDAEVEARTAFELMRQAVDRADDRDVLAFLRARQGIKQGQVRHQGCPEGAEDGGGYQVCWAAAQSQ